MIVAGRRCFTEGGATSETVVEGGREIRSYFTASATGEMNVSKEVLLLPERAIFGEASVSPTSIASSPSREGVQNTRTCSKTSATGEPEHDALIL